MATEPRREFPVDLSNRWSQRPHGEITLAWLPQHQDFIPGPGFPSAIRVFALTHSRRNVVQR